MQGPPSHLGGFLFVWKGYQGAQYLRMRRQLSRGHYLSP